MQRFRSDYLMATGTHALWSVQRGADPPDVNVDTPTGTLGMECTRLTVTSRLAAHGLFRAIRQRIAAVPGELFAAMAGHVVYMWFEDDVPALWRPFWRTEADAADLLLQALIDYRPSASQLWVEGLPDQAPSLNAHTTDAGATYSCVPLTNAAPNTMLFSLTGFEVGLAFSTTHVAEDEWAALSERIQAKDQAGNRWLLISAGAPNKNGITYQSEEALATFLLDNPSELSELKHLERITLHCWSLGAAVDVWPSKSTLFDPLYSWEVSTHLLRRRNEKAPR